MSSKTCRIVFSCAAVLLCFSVLSADVIESNIKLEANPDQIEIKTFYGGTDVQVQAEFPACDAVILELKGKETEEALNLKGRVVILWMNVAEIKVEHAPLIYLLKTSEDLLEIACDDSLKNWGIGIPALRETVQFTSDNPLTGKEFEEYLKLKENKEVYSFQENTLQIDPAEDDQQQITTTLNLPPTVPEGRYQLTLFCFREGALLEKSSTDITIQKTGMPLIMSTLAFQHAALYGVVAIIVAMIAGLLMGLIFSKGGGTH